MPLVTFYFQLHQPLRLHVERGEFLWEERNKEVFLKVSQRCYLPATRMFTDLVVKYPGFRICLGLSGTFLEQAERYDPNVLVALYELYEAGRAGNQVELLNETYYHSLVSLFEDESRSEFQEQVSLHRQELINLLGVKPKVFRNTELIYNNEIADMVAVMGYQAMLCEQCDDRSASANGQSCGPNRVLRAKGRHGRSRKLIVLARNRDLSDAVGVRYRKVPVTAEEYAGMLAGAPGEAVLLGYDYEHIGEHIEAESGIFDFWRDLAKVLSSQSEITVANPSQIAGQFKDVECPVLDVPVSSTSSWSDSRQGTDRWLGSFTQRELFKDIQSLDPEVKDAVGAGGALLRRYRLLTISDHWYYLHEDHETDRWAREGLSPYGSQAAAAFVLTRAMNDLRQSVKSFNVIKRAQRTAVILVTPETARLPSTGMGEFAQFVSGKSGGMGEVVSALCKGLADRRVPVHLITLNLARRFREESGLSETEWVQKRHQIHPENVHLVTSALYEDYRSAYDGNPLINAAEFQRQIVNSYVTDIQSRYQGRAILHTNDWMAGGVVAAYASLRDIPLLHTVHNTHTGLIPVDLFGGVNLHKVWERLYVVKEHSRDCVDAQATAIKNATKVSYVGQRFLTEVIEDHFPEQPVIPSIVRQETKAKFHMGAAMVIANGISPDLFPENQKEDPRADQPGLARRFGPQDADLVGAKRANLVKLQEKMGLVKDPDAILLYWPSRLDPTQKGIQLLEQIAQRFVDAHPGVQIAVIGDPVGTDPAHAEIMGRIAYASGGRIAFRRFDEDLSVLGYAAASDVFGASLYEPFGQIDVVGNIYGATATNRDTGGYADKISPLSLRAWGAPMDRGNGVLFKNYDAEGLWWGLGAAVENHRYFRQNLEEWQRQMQRIIRQARDTWSLENMVAGYMMAYEQLNGGRPLA